MQLMDLLASQGQMACANHCANRAVREARKQLIGLTSERISVLDVSSVTGECRKHLKRRFGVIVDDDNGDKAAKSDSPYKSKRYSLDDYCRRKDVRECPVFKISRYLRCRSIQPGESLDDHLGSRDELMSYLDRSLWVTARGAPYLRKLGRDIRVLEGAAGLEHVPGLGTHNLRHAGLKRHQTFVDDPIKARKQLDRTRDVHDNAYANCMLDNIDDMAAKAGHKDGHIRLYSTGIWASEEPRFRPLYDDIKWVSDAALELAPQLAGPSRKWGTQRWLDTNCWLADVLLQNLVAFMRISTANAQAFIQRTAEYPFLARSHEVNLFLCSCTPPLTRDT